MRSISVCLATKNLKKVEEFKTLFSGEFKITSLDLYKDIPQVKENGSTFQENASKKAMEISSQINDWVLADDSGLKVDFLNGEPGVFSARYAGSKASDEENRKKLLKELKGVSPELRKAEFYCALAVGFNGNVLANFEASINGEITEEEKGESGFGYDSIFLPGGSHLTFAEMGQEEKNRLSHRCKALEKAIFWFRSCGGY